MNLKERKPWKKLLFSPSKVSRSRIESTIRIRKEKKHEELKRRRSKVSPNEYTERSIEMNPTDSTAETDLSGDCTTIEPTQSEYTGSKKKRLNTVDETVAMVMSRLRITTSQQHAELRDIKSIELIIDAVRDVRRVLSDQIDPPIGKLLAHGLLPHLTSLIQNCRHSTILFEVLWCFVNVSSSSTPSHVKAIASSGIVFDIANLLKYGDRDVCEQAIWFIANMAGENEQYRNALWGMVNVTDGLMFHLIHPANISVLTKSAWAISNLFRGQSSNIIEMAIRFVPELVSKTTIGVNGRVPAADLVELMNALFSITECCTETCAMVLENGTLPVLIDAITYYHELPNTTMLLFPIVRMIWQFSAGTEQQTEQVILSGFLNYALKLLQSRKKHIRRDVLLALSNIAAGTHDQIDKLIRKSSLMKEIVRLANDGSAEIKKQALWTMSNIATQGTIKQVHVLVQHQCIASFCRYLTTSADNQLALVVLEAIETLLLNGKNAELGYVAFFEYCNGVQAIEDLQDSKDEKIYKIALGIIVNYFGGVADDDDDNDESCDDQNIAPQLSDAGTTFEFGMNNNTLPSKQLFPENVEMADTVVPTYRAYNTNIHYQAAFR